MTKQIISAMLIVALLASSCSTTKKSLALGLATGAGTGAIMGSAISNDHGKGAMAGMAVGALVGGIASYFIDKGMQERDQDTRRDTLFNLEKHGVFGQRTSSENRSNSPYIVSPAVVDEDYIETHVEDGTRLIEGHRSWAIQDTPYWQTREPREPRGNQR
jgi:hypothetical protein